MTIKEFLQRQEESTVKDVANYGVQSGAIRELIYTKDVVKFFDNYRQDIETVVIDYLESVTGVKYFNLLNYELMNDLENYVNVEFQHEDTYIEMEYQKAEEIARRDIENFEDMTEDEQDEAITECLDFVELDLQDTDKVQFVNLAVEIVAQDMTEEI
ncbi:hypothetical protein SEP1_153 [Staphylococcus phage phiIBB-SEP1]|uniref:DUF7222 domain-containing protein n=1 Tax=Staphylococcus phage phiIBB-SEP1 TaxID=1340769 RepID=W5R9M4_9CAUD|nr:hypothetical protein FDH45_gp152 [Staphylococcus phage phiIBB-SEP1]AGR48280.1 hypothetical protein SEP1_153 [Staphylococcus phage phiIBB-SEP1]